MSAGTPYAFDPRTLDEPRRPGISALLRVRNGADFLRLAVESHLPHYDEIVACYNDCSDDTAAILRELEAEHPGKVRVFEYGPKVHPPCSPGHARTPDGCVHGLAHYYNWCLARARYSVAVKLDDDHLAIHGAVQRCVREIRDDLARGQRRLYTFSGLNLVQDRPGRVAICGNDPFSGTGDILYFPVCSRVHWRQARDCEQLTIHGPRIPKRYAGLQYFHLKYLKPHFGYANLDAHARERFERAFVRDLRKLGLAEFLGPESHAELVRRHGWLDYRVRTNALVRALVHAVSGRQPPLRVCRLERLAADLEAIDWDRDLFEALRLPRTTRPGAARTRTAHGGVVVSTA